MNQPEINVTPLIDVLLVLLIIFMVITPTRSTAFDARIPSEPKNTVIPNELTLVVTYHGDGKLQLNADVLDSTADETSQLVNELKTVFAAREENGERERTVFIKAPKTLDFGTVAKLIDAVKMGGADPVSLQIDQLDP